MHLPESAAKDRDCSYGVGELCFISGSHIAAICVLFFRYEGVSHRGSERATSTPRSTHLDSAFGAPFSSSPPPSSSSQRSRRRQQSTQRLRVRFHIIRNARIEYVGESQSCMVSKLRIIWKRTRMCGLWLVCSDKNSSQLQL